jgi:hypothetical protein
LGRENLPFFNLIYFSDMLFWSHLSCTMMMVSSPFVVFLDRSKKAFQNKYSCKSKWIPQTNLLPVTLNTTDWLWMSVIAWKLDQWTSPAGQVWLCNTLELSIKSPCFHHVFGPAFTPLSPLSVVSAE